LNDWKILSYEELCDVYSLYHVRVVASRKLQWIGYVVPMEKEVHIEFWWWKFLERRHFQHWDKYGRIIQKIILGIWMVREWCWRCWTS